MKSTKRIVSLVLSILIMLSMVPAFSLTANAAGYVKLKHYMACSMKQGDYSKFNVYDNGQWQNWGCMAVSYAIGLSVVRSQSVEPTQFWYGDKTHWSPNEVDNYGWFNATTVYQSLCNGHPVMVHYTNGWKQHWVIILGANNDSKSVNSFICIDPVSGTEVTLNNCWAFGSLDRMMIFKKSAPVPVIIPKVTANSATSVTNTTAVISSKLSPGNYVQKWSYFISQNKNAVNNVNATDFHTHNTVKTSSYVMTYKRFHNSNTSPKWLSSASTTVTKLTPNKTYYYKFCVKINNKWYQSNLGNFKTTNNKPKTTTLNMDKKYANIGVGDAVALSWKAPTYANYYNVNLLDSNKKQIKTEKTTKTTYSCPSGWFKTPGTYYLTLVAGNEAGTTAAKGEKNVVVHPNSTVTFHDTVSDQDIVTISDVKYGASAKAPANPSQTGYTFKNWDKSFSSVKSDLTVNTVYEINKYTVKFVDGYNNKTIQSSKYDYKTELKENDYPAAPEHKNYAFKGWSEPEYTVGAENHTIYASYEWDLPTDIAAEISKVERAKSDLSETVNDGYNVVVDITAPAKTSKAIKGRVVVALKTAKGRLLIETESAAFVMYPNGSEITKTIEVFVPYEAMSEDLAAVTEAYVVNDYSSAGIISNVAKDTIKTAASNADEWQYSTTPQIVGENNVVDVNHNYDFVSYDLLKDITKDSLATTLDGYALKSSNWEQVGSGTIHYVKKWPSLGNIEGVSSKGTTGSAFNNNTAVGKFLYNYYNNKPKSVVDEATSRVTVNEVLKGGIYYHWCRGINNNNLYHYTCSHRVYADTSSPKAYYKNFHAFSVGATDDATFIKGRKYYNDFKREYYSRSNTASLPTVNYRDQCKDSQFWPERIPTYTQTWKQYTKKFTYNKTEIIEGQKAKDMASVPKESTSDSSETKDGVALTTTVKSTPTNKVQWYAYKTEVAVKHDDKNVYNIKENVGTEYAGKEVTVYVYKDNQVADFTTEYIGTATIDSDGKLSIENAQMREACSEATGDFTIAVALPGETNSLVVGKIEAPKPKYTVKFYDFDDETVVYEEEVEEGGTVTAPDSDKLNVPEGYKFSGWDLSTVGVYSNLVVKPIKEEIICVVTFVDWDNQETETVELPYGSAIEDYLPELEEKEGEVAEWDLSDCTIITETVNGESEETGETIETEVEKHIITGNTVITTKLEAETETVKFLSPNSSIVLSGELEKRDEDGILTDIDTVDRITDADVAYKETVEYEDRVTPPEEIEESEDYIFIGWRNVENGKFLEDTEVKENATYYPVYVFNETAETPISNVETGEYNEVQNVSLTSGTENAVIYYTTDGTDPATSDTAVEYTGEFNVNKSCRLRAVAMSVGMNNSNELDLLLAVNTGSTAYHILNILYDKYSNDINKRALVKDGYSLDINDFNDREGYTFDGFYYDSDYEDEFVLDVETITESLTLYAKYTPKQYTVTFKDYDGNVVDEQKVDFNTSAAPPQMSREGYVFIGWDGGDYNLVQSDIELTAKYIAESEYATVKLNRAKVSFEEGKSFKLKTTISPVELSNTELEWYSDNTDVAIVDEDGLVTGITPGTAKITVTVVDTGESAECNVTITADPEKAICLNVNSYLDVDSQGHLRRIAVGKNTVAEISAQFKNEGLVFYNSNGEIMSNEALVGTGTVIKLISDDEVIDSMTVIMTGDSNSDGMVDVRDSTSVQRHIAKLIELSYEQQLASDVNGDGYLDVRDSTTIKRYVAKIVNLDV